MPKEQSFYYDEAKYLDQVVRQYIPRFITTPMDKLSTSRFKKIAEFSHIIVDYLVIHFFLGIRIERARNIVQEGGKGFRPGHSKTKIKTITTKVLKRGKEVATKDFSVNITLNQ